ncbi:hypothetical protein AAULR_10255 [Lacticaseibacillus rhamnosus MTCC 5462]|nr:hypothetical protein AAULR_10255 [Lacticaseibacillus rhamnosus MTCC 5462]
MQSSADQHLSKSADYLIAVGNNQVFFFVSIATYQLTVKPFLKIYQLGSPSTKPSFLGHIGLYDETFCEISQYLYKGLSVLIAKLKLLLYDKVSEKGAIHLTKSTTWRMIAFSGISWQI